MNDVLSFPWQQGGGQNGGMHEGITMPLTKNQTVAVAFTMKDSGQDVGELSPTLRAMPHDGSHANGGGQVAVAFNTTRVRRLTPRECEKLQGFPPDYTLTPYRGKPAADGPRYKSLGNSMAVPVMRRIGARIARVGNGSAEGL